MPKDQAKEPQEPHKPEIKTGGSVADELASLNADIRQQGAQANQSLMEASIEEKAQKRRDGDKPVSAGLKKS